MIDSLLPKSDVFQKYVKMHCCDMVVFVDDRMKIIRSQCENDIFQQNFIINFMWVQGKFCGLFYAIDVFLCS